VAGVSEDDAQIIASFPEKRSALLPLLHKYQRERGWLSPETMVEVGKKLDLSPAQVKEVVSFYTLFRQKPLGKHHIQVCRTTSCYLCGAFDLLAHLTGKHGLKPGEVTPDGRFSLELVECIAFCHEAPAIQINMKFHGRVTPERVDQLLKELT
jgi:NADH-quinone oxidoreductase subunit E